MEIFKNKNKTEDYTITDKKNYMAELKCKRCTNFNYILFRVLSGYSSETTYFEFEQSMKKLSLNLHYVYCKHCDKKTMQEVVSYTQSELIQQIKSEQPKTISDQLFIKRKK